MIDELDGGETPRDAERPGDASTDGAMADAATADAATADAATMDDAAVIADAAMDDAAVTADAATDDASVTDAGVDAAVGEPPLAVAVSAGGGHSCAILDDARVFCWGGNNSGALGVVGAGILPPTEVPGIRAIALASGDEFTCALIEGGTQNVRCWGRLNASIQYAGPTVIPGLSAIEIAAGQNHVCARVSPGALGARLQCWGSNHHGHLGDGTDVDRNAPVASMASSATALGLGQQHSCAVVGASASCWGWSHAGQVGLVTSTRTTPHVVPLWPADEVPAEVAGGDSFSCARIGGRVGCWGSNTLGQLGDPAIGAMRLGANTPIGVVRDASALTAAGDAACVLGTRSATGNASVRCWGDNARGQVSGADAIVTSPRYVERGGAFLSASFVSMGSSHACAVISDGSVACWGSNWSGAIGDPTLPTGFVGGAIIRTPTPVVGLP